MKYIIFQQLVNTEDTEQIKSCAHCVILCKTFQLRTGYLMFFGGGGGGGRAAGGRGESLLSGGRSSLNLSWLELQRTDSKKIVTGYIAE